MLYLGKKCNSGRGAHRGGMPLMPDEWVVLRHDIARALLGDGLRIPMKPASQKFVEIDLEKDSLADIEAKLEALRKKLEGQGLMAAESGTAG
jgi:hypothetical protein